MTDKEKIIKELKEALDSLDITNKYRLNLIRAIEYLQDEPVSEDTMTIRKEWFEHCKESWYNEGYIDGKHNRDRQFKEPVSEELEKASYRFACKCHPLKTECLTSSPNPEVIEAFKTGAKWQKEKKAPVNKDLQEEITRYFSKNPIKTLTDWPVLKNTALHFANWQKDHKSIWHTMDETPNYPCDILFLTNVDNMFLYRYMENGRPVDKETPYFHNILNGKCWCYCNDIVNK